MLENIKTDYANCNLLGKKESRDSTKVSEPKMVRNIPKLSKHSVWGFIAKADGVVKGVPCKKGDVFKAAGWRGSARYTRGNIFAENQNYFQWIALTTYDNGHPKKYHYYRVEPKYGAWVLHDGTYLESYLFAKKRSKSA